MRLLFFQALILFPAAAWAAEPAVDPARVPELIRALGSRDFRAREQASRDLLALGRAAYPAVVAGAADENPEIRARCRRLLPQLFDLELQSRLAQFTADAEHLNDHGLPGWERFRKMLGPERPARDLFIALIRADGLLMDAIENHAQEFGADTLITRMNCLQQRLYPRAGARVEPPTAAEVAEVLFLATNPAISLAPAASTQINLLVNRAEARTWFTTGDNGPLMTKLLLAWLDRTIDEPNTGYMIANLLSSLQLKELTDLGLKIAANKKAVVHVRANIITTLGRMGQKEVVERLQSVLDDATVVSQFRINQTIGTTQIGDVALAMSIHLSGQSRHDYGFDGLKRYPNSTFSYIAMGFASDENRAAARQKWREWYAKQK
jgi:hypothetical protein